MVVRRLVLAALCLVMFSNGPFHPALPALVQSTFRVPALPGTTLSVTQGNGNDKGVIDHTMANGSYYAFDFAVGVTEFVVAAAQGGVVIGADDTSTKGCADETCWTQANYVVIADTDGTATLYLHLKAHSLQVHVGELVSQGMPLAQADTTGWATGPHLHFQVEKMPSQQAQQQQVPGWWWTESLPVHFSNPEVVKQDPDGIAKYQQNFLISQSASTTVPMPPTETSCPTPGTARAAVMRPLALGDDQNIVYMATSNTGDSSSATLYRYDMKTKKTFQIVRMANASEPETLADVSADGQWVVFSSEVNGFSAIQMIRMDGQGLQTLYCLPASDPSYPDTLSQLHLSPDQQQLVFSDIPQETVSLLTITTGALQTLVQAQPGGTFYEPAMWLTNTQLYMWRYPLAQGLALFLLNTQNGSNQPESALTEVDNQPSVVAFDISPDRTQLFTATCQICGQGVFIGPSTIAVQPAMSTTQKDISTIQGAIDQLVTTPNNSLLFSVQSSSENPGQPADTSHDGIWEMHTDGSGLKRLLGQTGFSAVHGFATDTHQDISPDGKWYLLSTGSSLFFAPLDGGTAPISFVSAKNNTLLTAVGWTDM